MTLISNFVSVNIQITKIKLEKLYLCMLSVWVFTSCAENYVIILHQLRFRHFRSIDQMCSVFLGLIDSFFSFFFESIHQFL